MLSALDASEPAAGRPGRRAPDVLATRATGPTVGRPDRPRPGNLPVRAAAPPCSDVRRRGQRTTRGGRKAAATTSRRPRVPRTRASPRSARRGPGAAPCWWAILGLNQ